MKQGRRAFRNHSSQVQHWSDDRWKACLAAGGGGSKRRYQYCSDNSGRILYLRVIGSGIFHHSTTLDVHSIFTLLSTMD